MTKTIKVPRLKPGQGVKGPEPMGCFNTGAAPVIYRSKLTDGYIVGPQMAVEDARRVMLTMAIRQTLGNRRVLDVERRRVWLFKTRGPAVKRFSEMCAEQAEWNRQERERHMEARRKANSDDPRERMEGALALSDF